jgi:hypothetical protein
MNESKTLTVTDVAEPSLDESETQGTRADMLSMWRMGKTQELMRNFRFVSIFGFSMILMASWETMLGYTFLPATILQA